MEATGPTSARLVPQHQKVGDRLPAVGHTTADR